LPRSSKFALNQIVQYTFDTTLCVGSLISSGVLDRFPKLRLILSHGGGALPYLIGRFDIMHERADKSQGIVAAGKPSAYLHRLWYDSILHDAQALRYLASRVSVDRIVLGSDDSFPPADLDPLASLQAAGFDAAEVHTITEDNPRLLFRL
jgi:aminocarboxymuconate-semialdehyde decarboxylase